MKRILIVEDNKEIAEIEKDYLEANQYLVHIAYDGFEAMKKLSSQDYDLIILDIMMPGIDGFSLCKELNKTLDIPIIFVTAKNENLDKIKGLGMGATDYMVKPFEPSELIARVGTHIRRYDLLKGREDNRIIIKDLIIEPKSRRVYLKGEEINFPNKEFDLLLFLAKNKGLVFSKKELLDRVWGMDAFINEATVAVHINRIRAKIEKDSLEAEYIETLWGAGYRFVAE